jgi:multicomponent Na+:H+ antiporter subunit G
MSEIIAFALIGGGVFFYLAGSIGLLRLPDFHSRLHALTKADNLGLGLLTLGLMLLSDHLLTSLKLALIWFAVLAASAATAHLIARHARRGKTMS